MSSEKTILVAGGAGYIGSHTVVELLNAGYSVVVIDDLSNSQENPDDECDLPPSLWRAKQITGRDRLYFHKANICDTNQIDWIFDTYRIYAVFDFTGKKAVGESTHLPILYYRSNVNATMNLLKCMRRHEVRNFLFSSSCTVYGAPGAENLPVKETDPVGNCHSPYGKCKYLVECMLEDMAFGEADFWRIIIMRYFNPIGAHDSGMIGEDPRGEPRNLMPKLAQIAVGKCPILDVFGKDYETEDGSPIRDYVHIVDVAIAHKKAIQKYQNMTKAIERYNIGSGKGTSTWEMVEQFERACCRRIPLRVSARRPGDVPAIFCDPTKAENDLGWKAERTNEQMCVDLWKFYLLNPNGYQDAQTIRNNGIDVEY